MRIHRGMPLYGKDETWVLTKAAQAAEFFASDLTAHFKAEEETLFPAMQDFIGVSELLNKLRSEHREMERLVERLRASEGVGLIEALGEFADLLEAHIRKEERELFPLYEEQADVALKEAVGRAIKDVIGDARQPRNPELLR